MHNYPCQSRKSNLSEELINLTNINNYTNNRVFQNLMEDGLDEASVIFLYETLAADGDNHGEEGRRGQEGGSQDAAGQAPVEGDRSSPNRNDSEGEDATGNQQNDREAGGEGGGSDDSSSDSSADSDPMSTSTDESSDNTSESESEEDKSMVQNPSLLQQVLLDDYVYDSESSVEKPGGE